MEKNEIRDVAAVLKADLHRRARAGVRWIYPESNAPAIGTERGVASGAPVPAPPSISTRKHEPLPVVREDLGDCTRCPLHSKRKNIVFGVGNPSARLMFIGEGPGHDEDVQGEPFVGKAGQLLTRIIEAIGLERADVYIANIVKCRPPGNRNPEPEEIAACQPFLDRQIESIRPAVLVTLGNVPTRAMLPAPVPGITRIRGTWQEYRGIPLMPTLHPAYLLRSPDAKRLVWEDIQMVARRYNQDLPPGVKPAGKRTKEEAE